MTQIPVAVGLIAATGRAGIGPIPGAYSEHDPPALLLSGKGLLRDIRRDLSLI